MSAHGHQLYTKVYANHLFTPAASTQTFHQFPHLPPEIRLQIWSHTILPPRLLDFEALCTKRSSTLLSIPLFSVCRESRELALKAYKSYTRWGHFEATFRAHDLPDYQNHNQDRKLNTASISPYNEYIARYLTQVPRYYSEFFQWHVELSSPFLVDFDNDVFVLGYALRQRILSCNVNVETLAKVKHVALLGWPEFPFQRQHSIGPARMPDYWGGGGLFGGFKVLETITFILGADVNAATGEFVKLETVLSGERLQGHGDLLSTTGTTDVFQQARIVVA